MMDQPICEDSVKVHRTARQELGGRFETHILSGPLELLDCAQERMWDYGTGHRWVV